MQNSVIDGLLVYWQQSLLLMEACLRKTGDTQMLELPIMRCHRDFSRWIKELRPFAPFDSRFSVPIDEIQHAKSWELYMRHSLQALIATPACWSWATHSRLSYQVSAEMQALLLDTGLEEVEMHEVPLPFRSFAVKLAVPLVTPDGGRFSTILFCDLTDSKVLYPVGGVLVRAGRGIFLMQEDRLTDSIMSPSKYRELKDIAKSWNPRSLNRFLSRLLETARARPGMDSMEVVSVIAREGDLETMSPRMLDDMVHEQGVANRGKEYHAVFRDALRIVLGLSLMISEKTHLHGASCGGRSGVVETRHERLVTTLGPASEVYVRPAFPYNTLSLNASAEGGQGRSVRAHVRRGHFRRLPGSGERIYIRPTWVGLKGGQMPAEVVQPV